MQTATHRTHVQPRPPSGLSVQLYLIQPLAYDLALAIMWVRLQLVSCCLKVALRLQTVVNNLHSHSLHALHHFCFNLHVTFVPLRKTSYLDILLPSYPLPGQPGHQLGCSLQPQFCQFSLLSEFFLVGQLLLILSLQLLQSLLHLTQFLLSFVEDGLLLSKPTVCIFQFLRETDFQFCIKLGLCAIWGTLVSVPDPHTISIVHNG